MKLTPELKMALCVLVAQMKVAQYRAAAPEGFDPKMTVAAFGTLAITAAGTAYSISEQQKAKKKAQAGQDAAMRSLDNNPLGAIPEAARYEPVDFNEAQLAGIGANQDALPFIRQLISGTNNFVTKDALKRAESLIPRYSDSMATLGDSTLDLLGGKLPFDDVLGIVGNRAGVGGGLNIPGVSSGATLKDLGVSRLDAMGKGAGLLGQMVSMAETVSPRGSYLNPKDQMVSPLERIRLEMEQHQLQQQSDQSANNLAAGADPNEVARLQLQLGNSLNPQPAGPDYTSAANQIIAAAGGAWNSGRQQGYWGTPTANAAGGYQTERASWLANPDAMTQINDPRRGWTPYTQAEWFGAV